MPSSKKKKQKGKRGGAGASSATDAADKPPRSNDEIIGNSWKVSRGKHKKSIVRELYDALVYEATSPKRLELLAKMDELDGEVQNGFDHREDLMPITYETPEMLRGEKCRLTMGKTAPFTVEKVWLDPPARARVQVDLEDRNNALRWTGEEPIVRIHLPNLTWVKNEVVLLGECWVEKEDVVEFACMFRKGSGGSVLNWPDCFACLQCPWCCKMAVPEKNKTSNPPRYIMILQNIHQVREVSGRMMKTHRAFPRLCCHDCFTKNLGGVDLDELEKQGIEQPEWAKYPAILNHGIYFGPAKSVMKGNAPPEDATHENVCPSAYSLFDLYILCGMRAAVSESIEDEIMKSMEEDTTRNSIQKVLEAMKLYNT